MIYGIIDENKKFILIDENREKIYTTSLMLVKEQDGIFVPMFDKNNIDKKIKEYKEEDIEISYNGDKYLKGFSPIPDDEYQSEQRAKVYQEQIDPITAHISRLKDEIQTEEIIMKIQELKEERNKKIQEIKTKFPYKN